MTPGIKRQADKEESIVGSRLKKKAHVDQVKKYEKSLFDLENAEDTIGKLQSTVEDLNSQPEQDKARLKSLEKQNKTTTKDLKDAKKQILKLTGEKHKLEEELLKKSPMDQTPDTQVASRYEQLQGSIQSWIDTEIRRYEDQWILDHDGKYPDLNVFRSGSIPEYTNFLAANYKLGGEYLVQSVVQQQLHMLLFQANNFCLALGAGDQVLLSGMERGLKELSPRREHKDIRYMRSEMLKGLAASDLVDERRTKWMSKQGVEIFERANRMLPASAKHDASARKKSFEKAVLRPAFDLAITMQTSSVDYHFSELPTNEQQLKTSDVRTHRLTTCTMINIDTRQTVRKLIATGIDDDSIVGTQVLLLAPGLIRDKLGRNARRLTSDVICVKVADPTVPDNDSKCMSVKADPSAASKVSSMDNRQSQRKSASRGTEIIDLDSENENAVKIESIPLHNEEKKQSKSATDGAEDTKRPRRVKAEVS
ncbi:MAG: hypothetical protein Q9220_007238 [cf. Caloplaca sp. 1 TL-2023]